MRLLLALLLCLVIPLQGFANAHAFAQQQPCPMEQVAAQALAGEAAMAHDCCNDAETADETGQACKPAQECKLSQACGLLPAVQAAALAPGLRLVPLSPDELQSFDPSGVWRPPTPG